MMIPNPELTSREQLDLKDSKQWDRVLGWGDQRPVWRFPTSVATLTPHGYRVWIPNVKGSTMDLWSRHMDEWWEADLSDGTELYGCPWGTNRNRKLILESISHPHVQILVLPVELGEHAIEICNDISRKQGT